jgi:8-oxo-dGTP pyrophosphatase MutT (NUDIX family)
MNQPAGVAAAVGVIIRRDGRLLLGLRSWHRRCCPGMWDLPGGHIEAGETAIDAARRELVEELSIVIGCVDLIDVLDVPDVGGRPMRLSIVQTAEWTGTPAIRDREHVALGWFAPEAAAALPDLAIVAYRKIFARLALDQR